MALLTISEPGQSLDPHEVPPSKTKYLVGIDLGTTHSLVAGFVDGSIKTFEDELGRCILPSVVDYSEPTPNVGHSGLDCQTAGPQNTISSIKSFMGKSAADIEVREKRYPTHYHWNIDNPAVPKISCAGGDVSAVEVSAAILKTLAQRALKEYGLDPTQDTLDGVVITVPAYFDEGQRQSTKDAAALANLNLLRLINEPTAAALAYGLEKSASGIHAIYDLGGGTFDISLLSLKQGIFEVIATGGNTSLGGDDIDQAVANWILDQMISVDSSTTKKNISEVVDLVKLRNIAKTVKESLSKADKAWIEVAFDHPKSDISVDWKGWLDRQTFDQIIRPIVEKSIDACRQVMLDADLNQTQIAEVVLVGGSTRIPLVQELVAKFFNTQPKNDIDPDRVVAMGAAIQAQQLSGKDQGVLLLDVTPLSLGIETMGGLVEKIIPRNTPIPVTRAQQFTTFKDGQTKMSLHVVQGERELVKNCRSLANFTLNNIPPMVAGAAKIQVSFQVDADGLLTVVAEELSLGVQTQVSVQPSVGLTDEAMIEILQASLTHAKEDVSARALREQQVEASRIIDAMEAALFKDPDMLTDDERHPLENSLESLRKLMKEDDHHKIADQIEIVNQLSEVFAERRMNASIQRALKGKAIVDLD